MTKLVAALIVKNEAPVLRRCFDSLLGHGIDRIIVNDNGSTDDTPAIIESYGKAVISVPGYWVDFATNRNLVLKVAREWGDYVFCGIDADEELVASPDIGWHLVHDAYTMDLHLDNLVYRRTAIVKSDFPWAWRYPVQEGLYADLPAHIEHFGDPYILSHRDGARARNTGTQATDLKVLREAVRSKEDPRMVFYLAQQLKDMGLYDEATNYYAARTAMGGYSEEVWYSQYMLARILDWTDKDPVAAYLATFDANPRRAEPLYHAADWCRRQQLSNRAAIYANAALLIDQPMQALFLERDVYEWRAFDVLASTAWYTPFKRLGAEASAILMSKLATIPEGHLPRIVNNHAAYTRI